MSKHRIELLDGFRFMAILGVLLFHYTDRWSATYPFGNFFGGIFSYGYLGVNFFFMISGFVISYTLENTPGLLAFYRNRFSRLFPAMLLCTTVTFIVIRLLDDHLLFPNAHKIKNVLPGLTFINPTIWTSLTGTDFAWISGSYWSLWTEVQFYIIASGLYFLNKMHFFRNILLTGIVISSVKFIPMYLLNTHRVTMLSHDWSDFLAGWKYLNEVFNITFFILWFLAGVIFYHLYKGFRFTQHLFAGICVGLVFLFMGLEIRLFHTGSFYAIMAAWLIMITLFLLMIYRPKDLALLKNSLITRIGVISYSIYLIHEDIGVLLINKYGGWLGHWSMLAPLLVIALVVGFAELSYRFYEKKAGAFLRA